MDGEIGFALGFGDEFLAQVAFPEENDSIQENATKIDSPYKNKVSRKYKYALDNYYLSIFKILKSK